MEPTPLLSSSLYSIHTFPYIVLVIMQFGHNSLIPIQCTPTLSFNPRHSYLYRCLQSPCLVTFLASLFSSISGLLVQTLSPHHLWGTNVLLISSTKLSSTPSTFLPYLIQEHYNILQLYECSLLYTSWSTWLPILNLRKYVNPLECLHPVAVVASCLATLPSSWFGKFC